MSTHENADMLNDVETRSEPGESFRHEALFYAGTREFVERTASFIRAGVEAGEPVLVVVGARKIDLLRDELGADADEVRFADMAAVGQNPARIIPAWQDFVAEHEGTGQRFRGVGEPIWAERTSDELVECERHEALLNLAFSNAPAWWLVCPYDVAALEPAVIEEAQRNHPFLRDAGGHRASQLFPGPASFSKPFDHPLPEPPGRPDEISFDAERLHDVRELVSMRARAAGFDRTRTDDMVLAVNEVATNSIRHGGGGGSLRVWRTARSMVCEVRDTGRIEHPMVGRRRPATDQASGFGLWLANQLCDLVQVRTFDTGSVVRLHLATEQGGEPPGDDAAVDPISIGS